jgi:hypothetical protein
MARRRCTTTAIWSTLFARNTDVTEVHENSMVEITGWYYPFRRGTPTEPPEYECAETGDIYLLDRQGRTRIRELTQEELDQIDYGRAEEALLDAVRSDIPPDPPDPSEY